MAVMMRLKRMGAKKKAFYRIVVIDGKKPRDGRSIDQIGYYDPMKEQTVVEIDKEKAQKWLSVGAVPTETVKSLLKSVGISVNRSK
jgi:small subunit ribosomal protein S16